MTVRPDIAFKIIDATEWEAAAPMGSYAGAPIDLADGYIHLSTRDQVEETARRHFVGRSGLSLLTVDLTRLGDTVVWEPSRGGDLFPHLYGVLPASAVTAQRAFSVDGDGAMIFADGARA